jgi:hypothetical protein
MAIFEGGWDWWSQFLKRTNQGPFLPSLFKFGPVVSEEMLIVNIFIFLQPYLKVGGHVRHNSEKRQLKNNSTNIWFKMVL